MPTANALLHDLDELEIDIGYQTLRLELLSDSLTNRKAKELAQVAHTDLINAGVHLRHMLEAENGK